MAENKTKPTEQSVTAFLDAVADETRRHDGYALLNLMKEITGEEPQMWGPSMVGFGSCHYKYESGREGDMFMVGFSPRKANLTLYIGAGFPHYDELMQKLGKHKTSKACLYVKKLADVDRAVLRELIQQSVAYSRQKYQ
jgi:hypothetical protein